MSDKIKLTERIAEMRPWVAQWDEFMREFTREQQELLVGIYGVLNKALRLLDQGDLEEVRSC